MKIDGKQIAEGIKSKLQEKVQSLKSKGITPHLAVILIGNDPASLTYVSRKEKLGKEIGVKVTVFRLPQTIKKEELIKLVKRLNNDQSVHGIIIQRPVPINISKEELDNAVNPNKDVDGFRSHSLFNPPVGEAVMRIMLQCHNATMLQNKKKLENWNIGKLEQFYKWLKKQKILVIGRGETAGKPIAEILRKKKIKFTIAHSKTSNLKELCLASDVIISCVGKSNVVRQGMIIGKSILIGVGLHPEDNHLQPDYDQKEIAKVVKFYTPVPGGVGPVNVACLFNNLISACERNSRL